MTSGVGTESYDPVLLGGKSVRAAPSLDARPRPRPCALSLALTRGAAVFVLRARPQLVDHYPYTGTAFKEVNV